MVFYQVQSNAAEIEAMRLGRLHVGGFSTGSIAFAVNLAGAVPFAVKGDGKGIPGLQPDRSGEKDLTVHEARGPQGQESRPYRAVFQFRPHGADGAVPVGQGLTPEKDYKILFSGKHDQSVMGVNSGDYDAAAVASDVYHRMAGRGQIKEDRFPHHLHVARSSLTSSVLPTRTISIRRWQQKMVKCFTDYRYPPDMQKAFDGADRFFPVTFQKDWEVVRKVAEGSGQGFDKASYDKETKREAEAAAAAAAAKKK